MPSRKAKAVVLVREVPDSYTDCTLTYRPREPINLELARIQHRAYIRALEELGLRVVVLPPDNRFPDSCFIEDVAVLVEAKAIITRMGAPTRNGEQQAVAAQLGLWRELIYMEPPAQLEGGDVLKVGKVLFVGESSRTNQAGMAFLKAVAQPMRYELVAMPVRKALHLKSVVSYLGRDTVIAAPSILAEVQQYMGSLSVIALPEECAAAANVLTIHDTVLMPTGYPALADKIAQQGFAVKQLEISEFQKGEGGLTCLSIIVD